MDTNNQGPGPGGGHLQPPSNTMADLNLNLVQDSNQTPQSSGQTPQKKVRKLQLGEYPSYIEDRALRRSQANVQGLNGGSGQQQVNQQIQGAPQGAENTKSPADTKEIQNNKGDTKDPLSSSIHSTPSTESSSRGNQVALHKPQAQGSTTPNGPRTGTPAQGLRRHSITGRSSLKSAPSSTPKKVAFADPRDYQNTPSKSNQESSYKPHAQGSSSSDGHRTATYAQVLQRFATTTSSDFKSQAQGSTSSDGRRTVTHAQGFQRSSTTTSSGFKSAPPSASKQDSSYKPQAQGSTSSNGPRTVTLAQGFQRSSTTTSSGFKSAAPSTSKQESHKSQARAPTSSKEQRPLVLPERPKHSGSSSLNLAPLVNNFPKFTIPIIGQPSLKLPQPAQPAQQASKAKQGLPDMKALERLSSGVSSLVQSGSSGHSNNLGPSHRTEQEQGHGISSPMNEAVLPSGPSLPGPSQTIMISKAPQHSGLPSPLFLIPPSDDDSEKENIGPLNTTGKRSRRQGSVLDEPLQEIAQASSGDDLSNVFRFPKSKKAKKDHPLKDGEDSDDVSMTGMDDTDEDDDMDDSFGSQESLIYSPTSLKSLKMKKAEKSKNNKALKSVKSGRIEKSSKSSKSSPKSKRQKSLGAVEGIDRRKLDAMKSNRNILAQQLSGNQSQKPQSPLALARADVNKRGPVQGNVQTPEKRARDVGKGSNTGSATKNKESGAQGKKSNTGSTISNKKSGAQGTGSSAKATSNNRGSESAQDTIKKPLKTNLKAPEGLSNGVGTINSGSKVSGSDQPAPKITLRAGKQSSNASGTNNRESEVQGTGSNSKTANNNGGPVVPSQGSDQIAVSIDIETDTESETGTSVNNGKSNLDSVAAEIESLQLETARSQLARSEALRRAAEATERSALTLEQNAKDKTALTHIKLDIAREEKRRLYVNYLVKEAIGVRRSRSR
jgi:hypothetical protein